MQPTAPVGRTPVEIDPALLKWCFDLRCQLYAEYKSSPEAADENAELNFFDTMHDIEQDTLNQLASVLDSDDDDAYDRAMNAYRQALSNDADWWLRC